ncbi:MAG: hypothetical protein J3K34DRAFT_461192 [Monoraphidium minutum]|nr:MAG: hypothetical protein J3K34DRAFT_461192 [Monoraphidium minutum]
MARATKLRGLVRALLLLAAASSALAAAGAAANGAAAAAGPAPPPPRRAAQEPEPPPREWVWDARNIAGMCAAVVIGVLTGPGGGGGAQLLYPLFQLVLRFDVHTTAALVSCVMALGAVTSALYAVAARHPLPEAAGRPLVDYATVLVVCPPILLGVSVGVLFNAILPVWLLQAATIAIFLWSLTSTIRSCLRQMRRDVQELQQAKKEAAQAAAAEAMAVKAAAAAPPAPAQQPQQQPELIAAVHEPLSAVAVAVAVEAGATVEVIILPAPGAAKGAKAAGAASDGGAPAASDGGPAAPGVRRARLAARLRAWAAVQPVRLQVLVALVLAVHAGMTLLMHMEHPCSPRFFGFLGLDAVLMLSLAAAAAAIVLRGRRGAGGARVACASAAGALTAGAPPPAADARGRPISARQRWRDGNYAAIQWRLKELVCMPPPMFVVGVIAGCLGLGGGFLVLPLLLAMGHHPQVQAATCKVVLLISTAASSLSLLVAGTLPLTYGLVYGFINLAAAPVGIYLMDRVIKATGRPSLLVILNVARFVIGTSLMISLAAIPVWVRTARGELSVGFHLHRLCKHA